ncbi:MAG TPA: cyclic nucleotide-binding domain-containing protein [Trebonia sp.]|nr:cyclic nucleotide-binding domain-containing protein [Trebonia sp.]
MVGDTAARLGRLGIFADLTEAELRDVAAELGEQSFPEGGWVLRQGETGTGLFIIVDGEVGVVIDDDERATLTTGSFFGEVSVLLGEPVTADIVVRKQLRCLVIPPRRAEEFLIAYPRVMYRMLQIEARRLRTVDPERD